MRHDSQSLVDWVMVGVIALALVVFFVFVQQNNRTITGNVVGTAYVPQQNCYTFTNEELPVIVTQPYLLLCPSTTHHLDYFELRVENSVIDCQDSTLDGTGGALFVPKTTHQPRVTLKDCFIQNFGGFYQNQNPVNVKIE